MNATGLFAFRPMQKSPIMFRVPSLQMDNSVGARTFGICFMVEAESDARVDVGVGDSKANLMTTRTIPETTM